MSAKTKIVVLHMRKHPIYTAAIFVGLGILLVVLLFFMFTKKRKKDKICGDNEICGRSLHIFHTLS